MIDKDCSLFFVNSEFFPGVVPALAIHGFSRYQIRPTHAILLRMRQLAARILTCKFFIV